MARKPIETVGGDEPADILSEIEAAEKDRRKFAVVYMGLREQTKAAKEQLDQATEEVCRLAGTRLETPLFGGESEE
jgi:hypothetical protein